MILDHLTENTLIMSLHSEFLQKHHAVQIEIKKNKFGRLAYLNKGTKDFLEKMKHII